MSEARLRNLKGQQMGIVAKIRKSPASEIWVDLTEYSGEARIDLREYFLPDEGSEWRPTGKGVAIPLMLMAHARDAVYALAERDVVGEVAAIPKGRNTEIRFALREYRNHIYADIRNYYTKDDGESWKPGKGITLRLAMLGTLVDAMRMIEKDLGV